MAIRRRNKVFIGLGVIFGALAVAYYPLILGGGAPTNCSWDLDLANARVLANSLPGHKPTAIGVERLGGAKAPLALISTGQSWTFSEMAFYSYQIVFPDQTIIVDTGMTRAVASAAHMTDGYDDAAWTRVENALKKASMIVVTHEHTDHLGGAFPDGYKAFVAHLRLTPEQLATRDANSMRTPDEARALITPLVYDKQVAIAPGVVLIKAPGHTPGSQMVFIQRDDGTEVLLLGDAAWQTIAVETSHGPPPLVSMVIHSDRNANECQIVALHHANQTDPTLEQVPGHDVPRIAELVGKHVLVLGFQP